MQRRLLQNAYRETVLAPRRRSRRRTPARAPTRSASSATPWSWRAPSRRGSPTTRRRIRLPAHDVGKIGIPDTILNKRGPLNDEERRLMKTHTTIGEQMLGGVAFLQGEGLKIVRHHHERWDGDGYPDKLVGTDIPLGARVFAVADALDAMTSDRPYRSAVKLAAGGHRDRPPGEAPVRSRSWSRRSATASPAARRPAPLRHGLAQARNLYSPPGWSSSSRRNSARSRRSPGSSRRPRSSRTRPSGTASTAFRASCTTAGRARAHGRLRLRGPWRGGRRLPLVHPRPRRASRADAGVGVTVAVHTSAATLPSSSTGRRAVRAHVLHSRAVSVWAPSR